MEDLLAVINTLWPIAVGFTALVLITVGFTALVFWLAKSHSDIEQLKEKVKTLFELLNGKIK
jgi:hypothetical protein